MREFLLGTIKPSEIKDLEPMSASVSRLAQLVGNPETEVGEVIRVVELDQALTANILRWANSAWSLTRMPIQTVREAVIRLGSGNILKLTVGHHVAGSLNKPFPGYGLGEKELWRHSVAAALAVENLTQVAAEAIPSVAFTAALLHDVGKLLVERHLSPDVIREIRRVIQDEGLTYIMAEMKVLGTDHAQIGAAIGQYWKFPETLVLAIANHHQPDAEPTVVQDAVHIGDTVAKLVGVGIGSEEMNMRVSVDAARRLGLAVPKLEALCAQVQVQLAEAESIWEVR